MPTDPPPLAQPQDGLYLGLMSGTSMDAVDAALVRFSGTEVDIRASSHTPWPSQVRRRLQAIATPGADEIERMGRLDAELGEFFAAVVNRLLEDTATAPAEVLAIGSHGQTIRHRPQGPFPFTLQIGDPNRIAERTGILTIADLRRRDMAAGGQGAPLVPAFHAACLAKPDENRVIVNIGGIANLTLLPTHGPVTGFDTGPGNTLMDAWIQQHRGQSCDHQGAWAASGSFRPELLEPLLADDYFSLPPPKSTGPEYFSLQWLSQRLPQLHDLPPADIQTLLTHLTARSIAQAIHHQPQAYQRVIVCGGGVHNRFLMEQLSHYLQGLALHTSADFGLPPDLVEAVAFAWLARQSLAWAPGNLPSVTGAARPLVLGGLYYP